MQVATPQLVSSGNAIYLSGGHSQVPLKQTGFEDGHVTEAQSEFFAQVRARIGVPVQNHVY